jgi:hypothetical protein
MSPGGRKVGVEAITNESGTEAGPRIQGSNSSGIHTGVVCGRLRCKLLRRRVPYTFAILECVGRSLIDPTKRLRPRYPTETSSSMFRMSPPTHSKTKNEWGTRLLVKCDLMSAISHMSRSQALGAVPYLLLCIRLSGNTRARDSVRRHTPRPRQSVHTPSHGSRPQCHGSHS